MKELISFDLCFEKELIPLIFIYSVKAVNRFMNDLKRTETVIFQSWDLVRQS